MEEEPLPEGAERQDHPSTIRTGQGFCLVYCPEKRLMPDNPDEQIAGLRERVSFFKKQVRLLLGRFERREISQTEARAEAERLGREVGQAERQAEQLETQRRLKG